jgi:hypothetical protein
MAGHGGVRRRQATLGVVFAVAIVLLALAGGLAPSLPTISRPYGRAWKSCGASVPEQR